MVFLQDPGAIEFHRAVESGLAAERGQERIRFFPFDYFFKDLNGNRFNVSPRGELGIGHDGRRIGIHQDHFVSLFLQRLAGLNSRVIKLAPLADDDWTGTD